MGGGGRPKYLNLCLKYSVLGLKKFLVAIFSNFIVDLDGREAVEAVIMFLSKALSSYPILISITLPKAQRTQGLSSYYKSLHKS